MNDLQIAKEVFLSIIKWFLLVMLANNLIWGVVYYKTIHESSYDVDVVQDGRDNNQEVLNGKANN